MTSKEKINHFIGRFTQNGKLEEVKCVFETGCCFWFASILYIRFKDEYGAEIVYDPILNHFACRINKRIYDITGDITDEIIYGWHSWDEYSELDELETSRIVKYCILLEG